MSILAKLLALPRLTAVVDVGAAPIDSPPPYSSMLAAGLCSLTGFEPNPDMLAELRRRAGPNETYRPDVIGDGLTSILHECASPGMNSILRPDSERCAVFEGMTGHAEIVRSSGVMTRCLDDAVRAMDMLKIDVQGAELIVFDGATKLLDKTVAIQTEAAWNPLYMGQPALGDIDSDLRTRGYTLFRIVHGNGAVLAGGPFNEPEIIDCDALYIRNPAHMGRMSDDQLGHLAMIAHHCYGARNLTWRCLTELQTRGRLDADVLRRYQIGG